MSRAVALVCAFDGEPPRVAWADALAPALPARVLADQAALEACLQNVLLAAVRLGAWLPTRSAVRLLIEAEPVLPDCVQLQVKAHAASESARKAQPDACVLCITAETPGRPLTLDEVDILLSPFGLIPPDKGGGTGLALFVARGLARAMGGDLEIDCHRKDATLISMRIPLRVADPSMLPVAYPAPPEAAHAGAPSPEEARGHAPQATPPSPELELSSRMFECLLKQSDDVFAICRVAQLPDAALSVRVEYISPSVERGLAFCQQSVVGQDLLDVCHEDDRAAFSAAIGAAFRGDGPEGHQLLCMHRSVTASGNSIWCHTAGLCQGDLLYLVCRDVRARKSVELALRAFTLATTHDVRESCNAILVSVSVLERRACIAALDSPASPPRPPAGRKPPTAGTHALDASFLVSCIRAACGLTLAIVGNVLTVPQVQAGELTLQRDVFSPTDVVGDVLQACRLGCAAANVPGAGIEWEDSREEAPLPPLVEGDRCRLSQVVQNLVRVGLLLLRTRETCNEP